MTSPGLPMRAQTNVSTPTHQRSQGRQGEIQALTYLQHNGLTLVERNFRCRLGEIDLIMLDHGTLVFVEVRKRKNMRHGGAAGSVTASKQARLISAAQVYLSRYKEHPGCRPRPPRAAQMCRY